MDQTQQMENYKPIRIAAICQYLNPFDINRLCFNWEASEI